MSTSYLIKPLFANFHTEELFRFLNIINGYYTNKETWTKKWGIGGLKCFPTDTIIYKDKSMNSTMEKWMNFEWTHDTIGWQINFMCLRTQ